MIRFIFKTLAIILVIYGIFWLFSIKSYPTSFGISFDDRYATSLGLDWKKTYQAMLHDLKPQFVRIPARWSDIEREENTYSWSTTDYLIKEAGKNNVKVTLVMGQKVPRWPECFFPEWSMFLTPTERKEALLDYVKATINRYKNNPAIEIWQVENEPFISFAFGECKFFDKSVVKEEVALVRSLDSKHKILITDSGELSTWYPAAKTGDFFGTTLYRVIRDPNGNIWNYDLLPAAFYKLKAKLLGLSHDKFFVAELQAEPWYASGDANDNSLTDQAKTFDLDRFKKNISYAQHLNASRAYLWGVEWWYWMKEKHGDATYWEEAKGVVKK